VYCSTFILVQGTFKSTSSLRPAKGMASCHPLFFVSSCDCFAVRVGFVARSRTRSIGCCGSFLLLKIQGRGIHAIAQSSRARTIGKYMTQVCATPAAGNPDSPHAEASVLNGFNVLLCNWLPETWPTCSRFEFGVGAEQRRPATDTTEQALIMQVPIHAGEGRLRSVMTCNRELLRRELPFPLIFALYNLRKPSYSLRLA
jgi:hypothetical protein